MPALGLAAIVVVTAAISRALGAGRTGQLLAALAAATCGEYIGAMHELTTTMPDFVFWAVLLLLVTRLLASQDPRWWLAIGGCAGIAAAAKWNIAFLVASLAVGFLVTDARRLLRSRYLVIGLRAGRGPRRARRRLAGGARLAEPGRVPRAADPGLAQPEHLLAGPGPVHRPGPDAGLAGGPGLDAAQPGGTHASARSRSAARS